MPDPALHLNLWKQRLGSVPDWAWARTDLETLVLADNDLTELSNQIGRLRSLRMLDMGHNKLAGVPDELGRLEALTDFLYLHDNQLASVPASIGELRELRQIDLRGNPLTTLPAAIARLPKLDKLDLRWVSTLAPQAWIADLEARGCVVYR